MSYRKHCFVKALQTDHHTLLVRIDSRQYTCTAPKYMRIEKGDHVAFEPDDTIIVGVVMKVDEEQVLSNDTYYHTIISKIDYADYLDRKNKEWVLHTHLPQNFSDIDTDTLAKLAKGLVAFYD